MVAKKSKIEISLTDFIDFVCKVGKSKQTHVKTIKNRPPYDPNTDFYKALREGIVHIHKDKINRKDALEKLLKGLTDQKKITNYPTAITGYKKFWGKKTLKWFGPPSHHWIVGDLGVSINPELGLECDDKFYVIKLYMKSEKLTKDRIQQILSLMEDQLRNKTGKEVLFAVLDVKNNGTLHVNEKRDKSYLPLLKGEASSFESIWKDL